MSKLSKITVIGLGNMGEALISGWLRQGLMSAQAITGVEPLPERARHIAECYGIAIRATAAEACSGADAVLLAVKPQDANAALQQIGTACTGTLVVSICAGVPLQRLSHSVPPGTPVVRVMPNTPALAAAGASVYCANQHTGPEQHLLVESLLGAVGEVYRVDKEELLDAVTGLSGSGPAYAFTFLEALADGGVLMGLPRPLARALANQTVFGAAVLAKQGQEHTAELRDRVTSPAGTTAAGLRELEARNFRNAVLEAVRAATLRSRELGGA